MAVELAEELNKCGIHADIMSMYTEGLPGVAEAKQELLERGIPNVYFLGMKICPPVRSLFPAIFKLRRLIREQQYDIIETSMLSPSVIASWATLLGNTRHVTGVHDVFRWERQNLAQHKFWIFLFDVTDVIDIIQYLNMFMMLGKIIPVYLTDTAE